MGIEMDYFAICTRCENSVFLKKWQTGHYGCPVCGEDYGTDPKNKACFLVDSDLATQAYEAGQDYFKNTDFGQAKYYFDKALSFNPNHYLAVYYSHMCGIYEDEILLDFDMSKSAADTLVASVNAVIHARVEMQSRLVFLQRIFEDCGILVSKYYSRMSKQFCENGDWDSLREMSMAFIASIKTIIDIDKDSIMVQNPRMMRNCISIADIGITACQNIVSPRVWQNDKIEHSLSIPNKQQLYKTRALFANFMSYAKSLDRGYVPSADTDFGALLAYNEKKRSSKAKKILFSQCSIDKQRLVAQTRFDKRTCQS